MTVAFLVLISTAGIGVALLVAAFGPQAPGAPRF
jgi:hypothetical protein